MPTEPSLCIAAGAVISSAAKPARKHKLRQVLHAWIRWRHIYSSLPGQLKVLFFGVTGLTLNHPHWFDSGYEAVRKESGTIDRCWTDPADEDPQKLEIVHWNIREKMEEVDIEIILQAGREEYPGVTPRIISDNGPQFIAKDFKHFIRLHSAIGYVTPLAMLKGRQQAIFDECDRKLEEARELPARTRAAKSSGKSKDSLSNQEPTTYPMPVVAEDRALPGGNPSAAAMPLTDAWVGHM